MYYRKTALRINLRHLNIFLSVAIIIVNLYVLFFPFWPGLTFWVQSRAGKRQIVSSRYENDTQDEVLIIPRLYLEEKINQGPNVAELRKGVWHRPLSSNPLEGSNTVLVGHRLTYNGRAVFFNLDKVRYGDEIFVRWRGKRYTYKVNSIKEVDPSAVEIEAPSDSPRLTLYTCTPLWTAKNRLVVQAQLEEGL